MTDIEFPALPYDDWVDTKDTLHLFLQIIGKIRLSAHPKLNHWWHVTLYPSSDGLTTGRIPYAGGSFQIDVDMVDHCVRVQTQTGQRRQFDIPGLSVSAFHAALFGALADLGISVEINNQPYENKSTIPFPEDETHKSYDPAAIERFRLALGGIASVFEHYRGRFVGKQTPVQLYWHSFDLAVTRFSGKAHPLKDARTQSDREAYSHEVISVGFWPGDDSFPEAAFYGYAYPEPDGLEDIVLAPSKALWTEKNGGCLALLKYEDMRNEPRPAASLTRFVDSLYEGAGATAGWPLQDYRHIFAAG